MLTISSETLNRLNDPTVKRLVVGLSGGVDSIALLHWLVSLKSDKELLAIHVNHSLQIDADAWQLFCRKACSKLGVPLVEQGNGIHTTTKPDDQTLHSRVIQSIQGF